MFAEVYKVNALSAISFTCLISFCAWKESCDTFELHKCRKDMYVPRPDSASVVCFAYTDGSKCFESYF